MKSASDSDLLARIDDLISQATTERSHYYTASLLLECRARLIELTKAGNKKRKASLDNEKPPRLPQASWLNGER
jgi:hypothetical protein